MTNVVHEIRVAGGFSQERAVTIAQTEVADAQIKGNWEVWKKSGVVKTAKWLVSANNPCPVCLLNKDKIVKFGEPFPSDAIMPTQHPSCRCALVVVDIAG
jgi:Phage Mu protein F like protein